MHLEGNADEIGLLNEGVAKKLKVGSLLVSANYANTTLVPTNGIFSSGRIQSNDSMLVGHSGNVTGGMLGYGLYYDGTFAQGLGSEYSSGALVLYKMLNPNKGKAGYNVPRAATGTPTYLKITDGTVKLGVGVNKTYTAGEEVTVTEHTLATLDAVNIKLGSYLPTSGGTVSGSIICTANSLMMYTHNDGACNAISVNKTDGSGYLMLGNYSSGMRVFLLTNDSDVVHYISTDKASGTPYRMWDEYNLNKPVRWGGSAAGIHTIYARNLGINGTTWGFLSENNSNSTSIYAPTTAGTSGQILKSSGTGAPVWANVSTILSDYATQSWVTSQGYLTSITKSMVTTALGYTPPTTNTTYSQATSSTLGLVKIGATGLASKNYAVQLNSSGQMYVAVPWTDTNTTYSAATSSTYGLVKIGATGLASKNYAVQLNSSGQMYVAVPWTDTDTNTHYTTRLYAGASGTAANSATTSPYIKVTDDNTYRNQIRLLGGGATSVSSDASGNITITSTNTTYGLATASSNGLMSSSQYTKLSNCIETVSATNMVTSVQVVDTIPATSSQVTGRLYLKFA